MYRQPHAKQSDSVVVRRRVDMARKRLTTTTALLTVLVVAMECASGADFTANVNIFNLLPETIQLHCWSGDRDLKHVDLKGSSGRFGWEFYSTIWWGKSTRFYCKFKWATQGGCQYFAVWTDDGNQACVHCVWLVKPDGFWRLEEGSGDLVFVHPWRGCNPDTPISKPE